jgi:ABC-2 type transport system ATP-binding protein
VEELADRVAILVGGQLVALQSTAALREELMRSSRMRVVLINPREGLLATARAAGAENVTLEGDSLVLTSRSKDRLNILRALEATGGHVSRFATEELSLEDIYMRYIREDALHKK